MTNNSALQTVVLVFGLGICCAQAQKPTSPSAGSDEATIRHIIENESPNNPDPGVAADLDWENSFGVRYRDLKKRNAFLNRVVAPLFPNGADNSTLEIKIKFIKPDVAVADEYWHIIGQLDPKTMKPGPDRWGRKTYVFTKNGGIWTEIVERIADLRSPYYKHYTALPKAVPLSPALLDSYAGSYSAAPDQKPLEISVSGDHLTVVTPSGPRQAIPTSATEFLLFNPDDLAGYQHLQFARGPQNDIVLTESTAWGETLLKANKAQQ